MEAQGGEVLEGKEKASGVHQEKRQESEKGGGALWRRQGKKSGGERGDIKVISGEASG